MAAVGAAQEALEEEGTGDDISGLDKSQDLTDNVGLDTIAEQDLGITQPSHSPNGQSKDATRPGLRREGSVPATVPEDGRFALPEAQSFEFDEILNYVRQQKDKNMEEITSEMQNEPAMDSLTLGQLKRIVRDMPKNDPAPYAFEYADSSIFEEELEELFDYAVEERRILLGAQHTFSATWTAFVVAKNHDRPEDTDDTPWETGNYETKLEFLHMLKHDIDHGDIHESQHAMECALYLALGVWLETAGTHADGHADDDEYAFAQRHVTAVQHGTRLVAKEVGLEPLLKTFSRAYDEEWGFELIELINQ